MLDIHQVYKTKWKDFSLILPSVSVGNVGQLAIDLLLTTLDVEKVGYLNDSSILPMVGPDPFAGNSRKLITSCEVYECSSKSLVIVQQRSPVARGKKSSYVEFMISWFLKQNFKRVILLSSSFAQFFTAEELHRVPMHYLCTPNVKSNIEKSLTAMAWQEFNVGDKADPTEKMSIPGGGVTKYLLEACKKNGTAFISLIFVCSEGNNFPEALHMANSLNDWLNLLQEDTAPSMKWQIPLSWNLPFGTKHPVSIY